MLIINKYRRGGVPFPMRPKNVKCEHCDETLNGYAFRVGKTEIEICFNCLRELKAMMVEVLNS